MAQQPDYRKATERAARKYGVDPEILKALINQESGFNPKARSSAGAQGIAQFMRGTAPGYGVNLNDGRVTDDLEGAARYIAANLKRTGGNYHQALSIYNSGRPDAYKDPSFAGGQTANYVKSILAAAGNGKVQGRRQNPSAGGSVSSTTTKTIPGVDNSGQRQALVAAYLANTHNPDALTMLAAGLLGAKDTAAQTSVSSKTTKTGGKATPGITSSNLIKSVQGIDQIAGTRGVPITAKQEPGHATGGDHDPAVKGATARDFGGSEQQRKALFQQITKTLGVRDAVYKGQDINVVKNGLRYQIISRDHGSGPHLHIGIRRVS